MSDCVDVEARFPRCRVGYEDAAFVSTQDPWHKTILCRGGSISPAGGEMLWACTSSRSTKAARMMLANELPCRIVMDGDDGLNAEFSVNDAQIMFDALGVKYK